MSRQGIEKAQHRGKSRRLSGRNVENLRNGIESLRIALGISNQPEPQVDPPGEEGFGIDEVLAGMGLITLAGIVNICF